MELGLGVNRRALQAYLDRVGGRWPLAAALLGGDRVWSEGDAQAPRGQGPAFVVVLVSQAFDGIPWLERIHQAGSVWDALAMGASAELHCYTPVEFERKRLAVAVVRDTAEQGVDLLAI